jgi:uncharacterized protein YqfA (UPF0365 family)
MAVAHGQEMTALVQERRAAVVEAEAELPRAMAEAFRLGHLGIMDYYKMKNVKADTKMRDSIAGKDSPGGVIPLTDQQTILKNLLLDNPQAAILTV